MRGVALMFTAMCVTLDNLLLCGSASLPVKWGLKSHRIG